MQWVASTGDSRAVIARRLENDRVEVTPLTKDQKPDDPEEVSELLDGGAVSSLLLFVVCTLVGGQLLSEWASNVDVGAIADAMN